MIRDQEGTTGRKWTSKARRRDEGRSEESMYNLQWLLYMHGDVRLKRSILYAN